MDTFSELIPTQGIHKSENRVHPSHVHTPSVTVLSYPCSTKHKQVNIVGPNETLSMDTKKWNFMELWVTQYCYSMFFNH